MSVYCDCVDRKFGSQLVSQCGSTCSCLSRSGPEIHCHVAGTLSNQLVPSVLAEVGSRASQVANESAERCWVDVGGSSMTDDGWLVAV